MQDDTGATAQGFSLSVALDGEGAASLALPDVLLIIIVLGDDSHLYRGISRESMVSFESHIALGRREADNTPDAGRTCQGFYLVGNQVGGVETHTELANHRDICKCMKQK